MEQIKDPEDYLSKKLEWASQLLIRGDTKGVRGLRRNMVSLGCGLLLSGGRRLSVWQVGLGGLQFLVLLCFLVWLQENEWRCLGSLVRWRRGAGWGRRQAVPSSIMRGLHRQGLLGSGGGTSFTLAFPVMLEGGHQSPPSLPLAWWMIGRELRNLFALRSDLSSPGNWVGSHRLENGFVRGTLGMPLEIPRDCF